VEHGKSGTQGEMHFQTKFPSFINMKKKTLRFEIPKDLKLPAVQFQV